MGTGAWARPPRRGERDGQDAPVRRPPLSASLRGTGPTRALVAGIGHPASGDGSAGVRVARLVRDAVPAGVRVVECEAGHGGLLDAWSGLPLAILVDTTRSGAPPGTISRVELLPGTRAALAGQLAGTTQAREGAGLDEVIGRGRALGRLPRRLVIIGIEGAGEAGCPSDDEELRKAVRAAARRVLAELICH